MSKRAVIFGLAILALGLLLSSEGYSQQAGVTNADIMETLLKMDREIQGVRGDVQSLRTEMKTEIKRLDGRIDELKDSLGGRIDELKDGIGRMSWFVGIISLVLGGLMVAILTSLVSLARGIRPEERAAPKPDTVFIDQLKHLQIQVETLVSALEEKGILDRKPGSGKIG